MDLDAVILRLKTLAPDDLLLINEMVFMYLCEGHRLPHSQRTKWLIDTCKIVGLSTTLCDILLAYNIQFKLTEEWMLLSEIGKQIAHKKPVDFTRAGESADKRFFRVKVGETEP